MPGPIRFYLDEDSSAERTVRALRAQGIDVLTAFEANRLRIPDAEQLEFAASEGRVIVTANQADYARLHHDWSVSGRTHAGIVIRTRQRRVPEQDALLLLQLVASRDADSMRSVLWFLRPD